MTRYDDRENSVMARPGRRTGRIDRGNRARREQEHYMQVLAQTMACGGGTWCFWRGRMSKAVVRDTCLQYSN